MPHVKSWSALKQSFGSNDRMTMLHAALTPIPIVDLRNGGPVRHALETRERACALRDDCAAWLPRPAIASLPAIDALTRRWLRRSRSPYVAEVEEIAVALGYAGVWFFN